MKTLTLITGLPYSGKTTKAIKLIKESKVLSIRLSPKEIQSSLFPDMTLNALQQSIADDTIKGIIERSFFNDTDVIVDFDSMNSKEILYYQSLARNFKVKFKHIGSKASMDTCIERAQENKKNYRVSGIVNEALRHDMYKTKIERPFYVVDVTFPALITDALIKKMQNAAVDKRDIILISCEPESKRPEVEKMIAEKRLFAMGLPINTLILAENGNKRTHKENKEWIMRVYNLRKYTKEKSECQKV